MYETKLWNAKCRHVSNCCIAALCTRKTFECLPRRFCVTGNVADRPRSGRPSETTAADDRYIVLHHLRNRRLTAAATGRQYSIHPQAIRNRLR